MGRGDWWAAPIELQIYLAHLPSAAWLWVVAFTMSLELAVRYLAQRTECAKPAREMPPFRQELAQKLIQFIPIALSTIADFCIFLLGFDTGDSLAVAGAAFVIGRELLAIVEEIQQAGGHSPTWLNQVLVRIRDQGNIKLIALYTLIHYVLFQLGIEDTQALWQKAFQVAQNLLQK